MAHQDEPRYTWSEQQLQATIAEQQAEIAELRALLADCRPSVELDPILYYKPKAVLLQRIDRALAAKELGPTQP